LQTVTTVSGPSTLGALGFKCPKTTLASHAHALHRVLRWHLTFRPKSSVRKNVAFATATAPAITNDLARVQPAELGLITARRSKCFRAHGARAKPIKRSRGRSTGGADQVKNPITPSLSSRRHLKRAIALRRCYSANWVGLAPFGQISRTVDRRFDVASVSACFTRYRLMLRVASLGQWLLAVAAKPQSGTWPQHFRAGAMSPLMRKAVTRVLSRTTAAHSARYLMPVFLVGQMMSETIVTSGSCPRQC